MNFFYSFLEIYFLGTKGASEELAGNFASQKICKDCPHRYVKEEQFTALSVEVRNQSHLLESLDLFVKGDLLEGNNAFFCEKCDKKVDTVMRTCIRHLPKVLVIQLKRFDYDWERETAIKFNDYFEFPRELDLGKLMTKRKRSQIHTPLADMGDYNLFN